MTWPQLFDDRITLSTGEISIRWITLYVLLSLIRWIAIYLLDSVIHPFYNWALEINGKVQCALVLKKKDCYHIPTIASVVILYTYVILAT